MAQTSRSDPAIGGAVPTLSYDFPDDFPQRLVRFKEESELPWAEIDRRLGIHPYTMRRWIQGLGPAQRAAHDGAARPVRRPGTGPPVHRVGKMVRAGETAADRNP